MWIALISWSTTWVQRREPRITILLHARPWKSVAADILEIRKHYMVVVDYFARKCNYFHCPVRRWYRSSKLLSSVGVSPTHWSWTTAANSFRNISPQLWSSTVSRTSSAQYLQENWWATLPALARTLKPNWWTLTLISLEQTMTRLRMIKRFIMSEDHSSRPLLNLGE